MGYYRDSFKFEVNLALRLPAVADAAPVCLKLADLISTGQAKGAPKSDEPETCPRRKRTSTGRKAEGERLEPVWPSDNSLSASSKFHASQGHCPFETVNGSCWNTAAEYLAKTAADFVAVQEAKILKTSIADTEQAARN